MPLVTVTYLPRIIQMQFSQTFTSYQIPKIKHQNQSIYDNTAEHFAKLIMYNVYKIAF